MTDRRTAYTAMAAASFMLAHQVAGKAVRDSFFLSNYPVTDLPKMVMASAVVSVALVVLFARAMARFGPPRMIPAGFLLSALLHGAEYYFGPRDPALWSVVIYLHIYSLAAILLSGFWSLMAESFDPHTAKQVFGRITGAGTLGGIAGGVLAERIAVVFSASSTLLLLTALHLACFLVLATLRRASCGSPREETGSLIPPIKLLRRAPYLVTIGALVLAGTCSAAILDYLFKAGAGDAFGKGVPLLQFFAIFYTSTQILTFAAQTTLAQRSLSKFGIGRTLSSLPMGVGTGALGALLFPAFPVFTAVRSIEFGLRGSLFRSGYELLYTPVPAAEKRSAKTFIDVACDRAGDALGSGIVQLLLWVGASFFVSGLLGTVLALAVAGVWAAVKLEGAYSRLVEQRLVDRAVELDLNEIQDFTTRSIVISTTAAAAIPKKTALETPAVPAREHDATLAVLHELRSGDSRRVLATLKNIERPDHLVAAQLIRLLAWDEVSEAVREVLQRKSGSITGLLVDYLLNQDESLFGIRRRIPRILARCDSQLAVHGLIEGLSDPRFEVRFQCSRALDSLVQRCPKLQVPADTVYAAVERELQVARPIRESRRLLDARDSSDPSAFLDEILRERADQSLEHIFSLFATVLPREPVKIAFRALHTDDKALRGLAIEYLDSALPPRVRESLWAMLEPKTVARALETHVDPLSELLRAHESLVLMINKTPPKE